MEMTVRRKGRKMRAARISLIELIIGIWFLAVIVVLAGVFFVPNPLAYVLGEVVGSATATLLMLHMYHSLDVELDLERGKAVNHSRVMILLRGVFETGVLFGSFFIPDIVLPYTVLAGLFGRKIAALMVPFMEKIRRRKNPDDAGETDQ